MPGFSYDDAGRLSTVTVGQVSQSRVYDPSGGVLLQADSKAGATLFLGETELNIPAGGSTVSASRTYTVGDVPVAERVDGTVLLVAGDANRSMDLQMRESDGAITRRFTDPFGNTRGSAVPWATAHGYLNAPVSESTGLTQLGVRAYDPVLGRFLSVDPVLAPDNPKQNNGYGYSGNNPVTYSDPDGKCYVAGKDVMNFKQNCGGGKGVAAPQISGHTTYEPQPGSYDDWAIRTKGDAENARSHGGDPADERLGLLQVTPDDLYGYWSNTQRYNARLEAARARHVEHSVIELELDPGSGICGDFGFLAGGTSLCYIKTLDGKTSNTVSVSGGIGVGSDAYIGLSAVTTTAESREELSGWDAGWNGALGDVGVVYARSSVALQDPSLVTTKVGLGVGAGVFLGGGVGRTWAW